MKLNDFVSGEFGNLICFAYSYFVENEPESEKDDITIEELFNLIYEIKTGEKYSGDYFSQRILELYFKGFMLGVYSLKNSGKSIPSIVNGTFDIIKRNTTNNEWLFCKNTYDKYIEKLYFYYRNQELKFSFTRKID